MHKTKHANEYQRKTIPLIIVITLLVSLSGVVAADDNDRPHAVIVVGTLALFAGTDDAGLRRSWSVSDFARPS